MFTTRKGCTTDCILIGIVNLAPVIYSLLLSHLTLKATEYKLNA